jgi:hypothetical protein
MKPADGKIGGIIMLERASESAPRCAAAARGAVPAAQGAPQAFAGVAAMCEASPGARPATQKFISKSD